MGSEDDPPREVPTDTRHPVDDPGALIVHGIRPGPHLLEQTPEFLYAIFTAMLIANFMWVFYLFGAFLLYTGLRLVRDHTDVARALPAVFDE